MTSKFDERILKRIENSLKLLNSYRPLNQTVLKKLQEQFTVEMTYNSNAIEGNRLTLKETLLVLREGITIKGKNLHEHLEAKNHKEAMNFLFEIVASKKQINFSHNLIRELHQLVVKDTESQIAGQYRLIDVQILGSRHKPPPGYLVNQKMNDFINWFKKNKNKYHSIKLAALAHHQFVAIHPFVDGNGRTGRLLMNLLLMRENFPMAIIQKNDRTKYYDALDDADDGNFNSIYKIVAQAVERSINIYLKAISSSSADNELVPLSKLAKKTEFSAKYLNLLARNGTLNAQKEGRNWYSSLQAVQEYKEARFRKRYKKKVKKLKK